MNRRRFIAGAAALPLLPALDMPVVRNVAIRAAAWPPASRVRPGDPRWPSSAAWERLGRRLDGELVPVVSPLRVCGGMADATACGRVFQQMRNPFYVGDEPGLTQTSGWLDAWTSRPSIFAVAARNADDVAAGVNFAREHNLRLVVRGGGHSYQGTSDAPDSLMIWTRGMKNCLLHEAFVPKGCAGRIVSQPAVSVDAGAMWIDVYDAVTTKAGRYVQGGGCTTVGVAGLVQSGGFGSFSKGFGTAAAGLLEAEIVTADGRLRRANARYNSDLFWAIKGGGGGSFGVVTRLTLRTHPLPQLFGGVSMTIQASSPTAYRTLLARFVDFYAEQLLNPNWGEQAKVGPGDTLVISMNCQNLSEDQMRAVWQPFLRWVTDSPAEYRMVEEASFGSVPAQHWWDAAYRAAHGSDAMIRDPRSGASPAHAWWRGDGEQVGVFLHAFESVWLPASLLDAARRAQFVDALFAATRQWQVQLHFNKGLAGAPSDAIAATKDTATNPVVLDAFALAISAAGGPPAFADIPGHSPDIPKGRAQAQRVAAAMSELRRVIPNAGSYVSESNYFEVDWQRSFWGANYSRLLSVKRRYDPGELFFVRHGVGTEAWSDDGFSRIRRR